MSTPDAPGTVVDARIVRAAEGEPISAAGVQHLFKLTGQDTGGLLGLEEFVLPAGVVGARPHIHRAHDEYFYVLFGRLTVTTGSGDHVLEPGDLALMPRAARSMGTAMTTRLSKYGGCACTRLLATSSTSATSTTRWLRGRS